MEKPTIEPVVKISGAAFNGNTLMGTRPLSQIPEKEKTRYVSLTEWCEGNFISKRQGRNLIKKKLLIAQRLYGQWWVCANPHCLDTLLEYLGITKLIFDADNSN
jgi:hypothetical protein